jgi:hypothetical protein
MIELTEEERTEIQGKIVQKMNEALNPNLDDQNEKRIALCAEFYELLLTNHGRLFLRLHSPAMERLRSAILKKIVEFAPLPIVRVNAAYMAAADAVQYEVEEINRRYVQL